jgi:CRP-like cAMP-binding protein
VVAVQSPIAGRALVPGLETTEIVRNLPELAGLSDRQVRFLLPQFDEVSVDAGTTIAVAGRPAAEYVVVLEGRLESRGPSGERQIEAGESTGWDAMWSRGCNASTVTATSPARLLVMGRAQFRAVRALRIERRMNRAVSYLRSSRRRQVVP